VTAVYLAPRAVHLAEYARRQPATGAYLAPRAVYLGWRARRQPVTSAYLESRAVYPTARGTRQVRADRFGNALMRALSPARIDSAALVVVAFVFVVMVVIVVVVVVVFDVHGTGLPITAGNRPPHRQNQCRANQRAKHAQV
jgi:hypothetical protein